MNFEELLFRANQGEIMAIQQILEMYRPLLLKHAMINGVFDEDLYQELTVEVLKCIRNFKKLE